MLRTHPLSTGRVAEARARSSQLPRVNHVDSIGYGLAKARIRVLFARRPDDALAYYQLRADSGDPADRYGLALSLDRSHRNDEAERIFRELSDEFPGVVAYRIGRAEALLADGLDELAAQVYEDALRVSPRNTSLVISYAEAMIEMGRPAGAHAILLDLLNNVRPTPGQIQLLARAAEAEGDLINAYHYLSEYFASVGDFELAVAQLQKALTLDGINDFQSRRFRARIVEFEEVLAES
jgi:predicted Zn-dependent protease